MAHIVPTQAPVDPVPHMAPLFTLRLMSINPDVPPRVARELSERREPQSLISEVWDDLSADARQALSPLLQAPDDSQEIMF